MNKRSMPEYRAWKAMKARCYAPSSTKGTYREARISVCDEWRNDFDRFLHDMGHRPSSAHSLDRIDNARGYEKSNCRWATQKTQCSNRGAFNKVFTHKGETLVLKAWAERFGIKYTTLYQRIYRSGMPFERAISKSTKGVA